MYSRKFYVYRRFSVCNDIITELQLIERICMLLGTGGIVEIYLPEMVYMLPGYIQNKTMRLKVP